MFTRLAKEKDDSILPILDQINEENQFNLDKYKVAGEIVEKTFNELKNEIKEQYSVVQCSVVQFSVVQLCEKYDNLLMSRVKDVYKHKSFDNGLSFPTCISVNNQAGYNSPLLEYDIIVPF